MQAQVKEDLPQREKGKMIIEVYVEERQLLEFELALNKKK